MKIHEKMSRETIQKIQEKKFRKILKYAYKNSKFYRILYNSNGITEKDLDSIEIKKIPEINKDIIMKNFDDIITVNDITKKEIINFLDVSKKANELFKNKYHIIHTSGSSGKLGIFVYSKKDWDTFFPYITKTFNFKIKKNKSVFIGAVGGHYTGASFISWTDKGLTRFFNKPLILDVNEPLNQIINKLNRFQPNILGGYFNGIMVLAKKQNDGELKIDPEIIVNCGEGINTKDKKIIEKCFNAEMSNLYGFAECVVVGVGKNEYDGIYLMDDIAMIEVKEDHILLTNLYNKTQPIIRYRINDYIKLKDDQKKIMPFTLIDDIVGRAEFVIWFVNKEGDKDFIHPLIFTDFYVKGLDKLQIVITSKTSFDFKAVISGIDKEKIIRKITEKLDKILEEKNFTNVKYKIKIVNEILTDKKTGKFKLILNNN
jgi:phenylacetate-CoA ligase